VRFPAAKSFALIACLHLMGGHWFALQTVAWVGMFVENRREAPLTEALEKTFDGEHPCSLCCVVKKGLQEEGEKRPVELVSKVNAVLNPAVELPPPVSVALVYFETPGESSSIRLPLPSPPPWRA